MGSSFITLFGKPHPTKVEPPPAPERGKGLYIPFPVSLLFIPVLLIGAGISIPWTYIDRRIKRRREERFAEQMQALGRSMTWTEFESVIESKQGTFIGEYLSSKGPYRLWWTNEDIPAISPHQWEREEHFAGFEPEFAPFFEWCYARFTNPQLGIAKLVIVPAQERKDLNEKLKSARFVSTCSFLKAFEKVEK